METNRNKKTIIQKAVLPIWLALPFVLLLLPSSYFDAGTAKCISVILLDIECPGCGITRGVMRALHFDFTGAWAWNKMSIPLTIVLILFWIHILGQLLGRSWLSFMRYIYAKREKSKVS